MATTVEEEVCHFSITSIVMISIIITNTICHDQYHLNQVCEDIDEEKCVTIDVQECVTVTNNVSKFIMIMMVMIRIDMMMIIIILIIMIDMMMIIIMIDMKVMTMIVIRFAQM